MYHTFRQFHEKHKHIEQGCGEQTERCYAWSGGKVITKGCSSDHSTLMAVSWIAYALPLDSLARDLNSYKPHRCLIFWQLRFWLFWRSYWDSVGNGMSFPKVCWIRTELKGIPALVGVWMAQHSWHGNYSLLSLIYTLVTQPWKSNRILLTNSDFGFIFLGYTPARLACNISSRRASLFRWPDAPQKRFTVKTLNASFGSSLETVVVAPVWVAYFKWNSKRKLIVLIKHV